MSRTHLRKGAVSNDAPHTAPAWGTTLALSRSLPLSLPLSFSLARSLARSLSQDCQEWYTSPTFITGQSRQGQPPLECSVSSHELPTCVRGHMRMGMCVCARVRRKRQNFVNKQLRRSRVHTCCAPERLTRCSFPVTKDKHTTQPLHAAYTSVRNHPPTSESCLHCHCDSGRITIVILVSAIGGLFSSARGSGARVTLGSCLCLSINKRFRDRPPQQIRYLPSVTDDGLEYNLKTCIPERLANKMGH
jgi:hypothetical protein